MTGRLAVAGPATVTVVGLGKIGLPLAVQMAGKGARVRGADVDPAVVRLVSDGRPPFAGEPGLAGRLDEVVNAGLLTATTDTTAAVAESDVVVVVVPLDTRSGLWQSRKSSPGRRPEPAARAGPSRRRVECTGSVVS